MRTELLEHLVALVEDKVLDALGDQLLVPHELRDAARRAHDDVRRLRLEDPLVLGDGDAAVEDLGLGVGEVAGEALELVGDLVGELARVAEHQRAHLRLLRLQLVQAREHEDGRLPHPRLCLAEHVHAEDGLRDALVLDLGGVLEAAVDDGAEQLGLQEEVAEARRVDARVGAAPGETRAGGERTIMADARRPDCGRCHVAAQAQCARKESQQRATASRDSSRWGRQQVGR